jgi:Spy/CpxP family protein refolding chaperone
MAAISGRLNLVMGVVLCAGMALECRENSGTTPPAIVATTTPTSASVDDETGGLIEHHRYHHHGGVTLLIAMSLDLLGVSPEQQAAVDKIRTELHARMAPARAAEQILVALLADGIAGGSIDVAKADAAVAQVSAAAATVHEASSDALNELHRALTPVQRGALVDKVEAHWGVWQRANAEATGPASPTDGHLAMLATDLGLTQDQVARIRTSLAEGAKRVPRLDTQEVAMRVRAFGDAFRGDRFDAKALTTASGVDARMVTWGAARLAYFMESVGPLLTPEQRADLASELREHAAHDPSAEGTP